ncbi:hypothetical protein PBAL39_01277 [Pedobacter sp. BAL39]|uniref:hypothetical protein n=1 Tax=Pedobacter sp. BAL39 TaxID=391596 RepID=UPI0001559398|nr:hypothetical protein [Pedobacter sp. BAL39]EDM38204.1 hypothetical protein PBAL39_01277 [Pedobacter sp. BAL39]
MSLHPSFWQHVVAVFQIRNTQPDSDNCYFPTAPAATSADRISAKDRTKDKKIKRKKLLKPIYLT